MNTKSKRLLVALSPVLGGLALGAAVFAADHDDTNALKAIPRHDARITDLHAFTSRDRLVIAVSTNPTIPKSAASYRFPSDVVLRVSIDATSKVVFNDAEANATWGGRLVRPDQVHEDYVYEVRFDDSGNPRLRVSGLGGPHVEATSIYAGLRDDAFIRGPRRERNIGALVIETPLPPLVEKSSTLLIWANSFVSTPNGMVGDLGGRALRSQFVENLSLNDYTPAEHYTVLGTVPDVVIFDTSRAAAFPNGRALTDDVVDLVGDGRILSTDSPFPSVNDRPFLARFPYLADPHPPCGAAGQVCCAVGDACDAGSACGATSTCEVPDTVTQ